MAASAASVLRNSLFGTAILTIPVLIWVKDKGYGLYYVSGNSMEPTLRSGDVVLVRRVNLPLHITTQNDGKDEGHNDELNDRRNGDDKKKNDEDSNSNHESDIKNRKHVFIGNHSFPPNADEHWERDLEDAYARRREELSKPRDPRLFARQQLQWQRSSWWGSWGTTPLVLHGQVIVFWSPTHFQQLCIKRVIGVGGQIVLPRDFPNRMNLTTLTRRDLNHYLVPPCFWYVEGDNADNSTDSRRYGPVPQRLLVGVVDRIVWPLERAQPLSRSTATLDNYPITRAWWQ